MNYVKRILATAVIGGMLPLTAAQAGGFGAFTNSTTQHTAEVMSLGSGSIEAYLTVVEGTIKSEGSAGTTAVTAGSTIFGLDPAASVTYTPDAVAPQVVVKMSAETGTYFKANDTITFTGAALPGGLYTWTCAIAVAAGAGVEISGVTSAQVINATAALSHGVYSSCTA